MRSEDMFMIQDTDEYRNVRQTDVIVRDYYKYEMFHFTDVRYGSCRSFPFLLSSSDVIRSRFRPRQGVRDGQSIDTQRQLMAQTSSAAE